jgi:hypothetical protein
MRLMRFSAVSSGRTGRLLDDSEPFAVREVTSMPSIPRDVGRLLDRSKEGSITPAEVESVVAAIESSDGKDHLYTLIHIIARSRPQGAEALLRRHLEYREDPPVAALALTTLGVQWSCFDQVRDFTMAGLDGLDWDAFSDVQNAAIGVAGEALRTRSDCELLERLLALAMDSDKWTAGHRYGALARALGASQRELSGISPTASEWTREAIARRARVRLDRDCS